MSILPTEQEIAVMRTVSKTAKCNRCGSETVTWHTAKKTGKFYLTEVFTDKDGDLVSSYRDFHSIYCDDPEAHDAKQAELIGAEADEDAVNEIPSAHILAELYDMCENHPDVARELLKTLWDEISKIPPGSDASKLARMKATYIVALIGDTALNG